MRVLRTIGLVSCLVGALAVSSRAEDLTIISKVTARGEQGTSTLYMTANKMRQSRLDVDMIVDLAAGKYVSINHKKKQYWEMTRDEFANVARPLQQNPQAAEMMERLMGGSGQPVIQKGPGTKKIAGYDCEEYDVTMGKMINEKLWVAPSLVPPFAIAEFMNAQKATYAGMPMASSMGKLMDEMAKIKGFPLGTTNTVMNQTSSSEATEVKLGPVPDSAFAIPADYTKVDSPLGRMSHH